MEESQKVLEFIQNWETANNSDTPLDFHRNYFKIPYFPENVRTIVIQVLYDRLPKLPSSLRVLKIKRNLIDICLDSLPEKLEELFIDSSTENTLILPKYFPATLRKLYLIDVCVLQLPELPDGLVEFSFTNTHCDTYRNVGLMNLPKLPETLKYLNCSGNRLTCLGTLPIGLEHLICSWNNIKSLPSIPKHLKTLICTHNKLTRLPILSNTIEKLWYHSNPLIEQPILPASVIEVYGDE